MKRFVTTTFILCSMLTTPLLRAEIVEEPYTESELESDELFLDDDTGPYEVSEAPYDYNSAQRKNLRNKGVLAIGTIAAAVIAIIVASSNNGDPHNEKKDHPTRKHHHEKKKHH